jgi:hypothetical protein
MQKLLLAASALLLAAPVNAAGNKSPLSPAELAQITERGRLLEQYDQAAWHSTDAVQALNSPKGAVKLYVAQKTGADWIVAYGRLDDRQDKFLIVYEATQGFTLQQFSVKHYDPPKEDTGFYLHGAIAIDTALKDFGETKQPYNAMVLPTGAGNMFLYLVPAQTVTGVYPMGGDARYLISPDGKSILVKRQLHKSILTIDLRSKKLPMAHWHTHVLSDVPEDTDVFTY